MTKIDDLNLLTTLQDGNLFVAWNGSTRSVRVEDAATYFQSKILTGLFPTATAADIASATASINTAGKFAGRFVWDTNNNRLLRAAASGAVSPWHVVDGSATVTPA